MVADWDGAVDQGGGLSASGEAGCEVVGRRLRDLLSRRHRSGYARAGIGLMVLSGSVYWSRCLVMARVAGGASSVDV